MGIMESTGGAKAPHVALITMDIKIHELLNSGDVNPRYLSNEELDKFGITNRAVLRVNGFDRFDCIKKLIEIFQTIGEDGIVEGVKDV
tara:strand:- start:82 stop:345 length:264 start_codon:yes stop_codon:yes gene_type:complete